MSVLSLLLLLLLLLLLVNLSASSATPRKLVLVQQQPLLLNYHSGPLLKGNYTLNLLYYGKFSAAQRAVIADFIRSLSTSASTPSPSVAAWWATTSKYRGGPTKLSLGRQLLDPSYSLGRSLTTKDILALASGSGPHRGSITAVLTSSDVSVSRFCTSTCGSHGSAPAGRRGKSRFAYLWVGNPANQCPGQCAWPFHQPMFGPQTPPLVAPNGDVGVDGMVINLATVLAGTVTNPFGSGFYQGSVSAPLEAVSACTGTFGAGSYPGNPGQVLLDPTAGGSYNANGLNGRKYLLPAMWDPKTSQCATLV